MNKIILYLLLVVGFMTNNLEAQVQKSNVVVGFYNLENLFDTIDDSLTIDEEYLPDGRREWTNQRYEEKLKNLALVISQLGTDDVENGVAVLGLAEIENRKVLEDLVAQESIEKRNYQIVHIDSKDARGIDVALLYNPEIFTPSSHSIHEIVIYDSIDVRDYTRDILLVTGSLEGDEVSFLVNHWPSRYGGEEISTPKRAEAARVCKTIVDSLIRQNSNAKIVIMGDLNDDPVSPSVVNVLGAKKRKSEVSNKDLYNPMWDLFRRGFGSNTYRGAWNLFDQMIVSGALLNTDDGIHFDKAIIFKRKFMIQDDPRYGGYPLRTFGGQNYLNGYSDHMPALIYLTR